MARVSRMLKRMGTFISL
uniref:Uncharacterized protein n=1 Tax=Anguilla anguilla TaxID=7936 RepID=A0A0E9STI5_ANGAN